MSRRGLKDKHSTHASEKQLDAIEAMQVFIKKQLQEAEREFERRQKAIEGQQVILVPMMKLGKADEV